MPTYTVVEEGDIAVPMQHPAITLVNSDGTAFNPADSIPAGTYVPADPVVALTYNPNGTVATATENGITTSFTYNADLTVATTTRLGVTRTYTYTTGNLTSVA